MGGGEAFPGFPVPNPTVSYWQVQPHAIANHRTTESLPTTTFDYVIIGSGITGASIAHKLLSRDPSLSVLMIEARTAASGASGRNGGLCRAGFWLNFKKYVEAFGEDEALKFERLEEENVRDMADFVRTYNVKNDFLAVQTADVYVTEEAWAEVLDVVKLREEVRQRRPDSGSLTPRKVWQGKEARERMGMPSIVGAVTWPAYTQNPYLLVCKMLELDLEKGLNLQTNTPALKVVQSEATSDETAGSARWDIETDRGTVRAKQVVLATNAYTNTLHSGLRSTEFLTPGRSQVTAMRPGSNISGNPSLRGGACINDIRSGDYFSQRAPGFPGEGDILYGGGRAISKTMEKGITDDSKVHPGIATYFKHAPPTVFGKEAWGEDGGVVREWSGITCYTPDTFPLVGEAPGQRGLWMSVGMNGHGSRCSLKPGCSSLNSRPLFSFSISGFARFSHTNSM
jgi:glycine/D-amino acid oxidase-like deaminating enzyme